MFAFELKKRTLREVGIRLPRLAVVLGALCASQVFAATAPLPCNRKSCIYFGWDSLAATVQDVHRNRDKFAATGFDGIAISVNGKRSDGGIFKGHKVMAVHRFSEEEFKDAVPLLKEILSTKGLDGSYMMIHWMGTKKRRIGWADDAAWGDFCANMRLMCALAKGVGFKGLFIDHEDYTGKPLFIWRRADDPPYAETVALARRRGGETARAMAAGDPTVRALFDRVLMQQAGALRSQTPHETAAYLGDLWYPFLNGFIEAMPPEMRIVEGCENAYGARTATDYRARIGDCRSSALVMLEPQLRAKYLAQSEMSFGKYLDGWRRDGLTTENGIPEALFGAGLCCDRVFWVYGEKASVVDWGRKTHPRAEPVPWSEKMPGLPALLRLAVGDYADLRARAASGSLENLVANSGCASKAKGKVPAPFRVYPDAKDRHDMIVHDAAAGCAAPGSLRVNDGRASLTVKVRGVKPGDRLYASFVAKGDGVAGDFVWVKEDGAWAWKKGYQYLLKPEPIGGGWKRYECVLVAPEGIAGAGFVISSKASPESPVWLDDISIYRW